MNLTPNLRKVLKEAYAYRAGVDAHEARSKVEALLVLASCVAHAEPPVTEDYENGAYCLWCDAEGGSRDSLGPHDERCLYRQLKEAFA